MSRMQWRGADGAGRGAIESANYFVGGTLNPLTVCIRMPLPRACPMNRSLTTSLCLVLANLAPWPSALADSRIDADLELSATVESVVATVIGTGARSSVDVAVIENSRIRGSLSVRVDTGSLTSTAIGLSGDAIEVGAVVDSTLGGGRIRVTTGDIASTTAGFGQQGGVRVGSVRGARNASVELTVSTGRIVNVTGPQGGDVSIGNIGR